MEGNEGRIMAKIAIYMTKMAPLRTRAVTNDELDADLAVNSDTISGDR
jgi:hypothetical protein